MDLIASHVAEEPDDAYLPFVDEHTIGIAASREQVWTALARYAVSSLRIPEGNPLAKVLGTDPPRGFEITATVPGERLTLAGRHRFSRYQLTFEVVDAGNGETELRAETCATFPGVAGRIYRALVIGTRAHVVATNHVLRSIGRLTVARGAAENPKA